MPDIANVANGEVLTTRLELAPFSNWGYQECEAAVKRELPSDYKVRFDYAVLKDHYRDGDEWVGPGEGKDEGVKKQFVADDFMSDALDNLSNAFLEPQLGTAPLKPVGPDEAIPATVQARMDEAEELLTWWWDKRRLQEGTLDRLRTAAWNGFSVARLWIAARHLLRTGNTVSMRGTTDMRMAMSFIHLSLPMPAKAAIVTHVATQEQCAIFLDEHYDGDVAIHRAEMVYLDPNRETDEDATTFLRIVYADGRDGYTAPLRLGGRLLSAEMRTKALLTEPVLRTQRQLNFIATMVSRMTETAGFRGRYIINAKPLGKRTLYNDGDPLPEGAHLERDEDQRLWAVQPQHRTLGSKVTTELVGLPKFSSSTPDQVGYETPGVILEDPVDPGPYILAAEAIRRRGLRMCSQGHLAQTSTAEASGFAYEQSRATFEKDLNRRRFAEEGMLRELLTQLLAFAEFITGRPGYFTDYIRVTIDQRIDAGPRSPDSVRLDMEAYEMGLLGQETAMSRIQVEDITAEITRLRTSSVGILGMLEKAAAIVDKFGPDAVIRVLGMMKLPEQLLTAIKPLDIDRPIGGVNPNPDIQPGGGA